MKEYCSDTGIVDDCRLNKGGPAFSSWLARAAFGLMFILFILYGCAPGIALYSEKAYDQAVTLKVKSLRLMDKAGEPYDSHLEGIEALLFEMDKAHEYAKGRPRNELSARQWEILKDPGANLLGGFMMRWKEQDVLPLFFIREAKAVVSDAFDAIIGLESGKIRPSWVK